MRTEKQLGCFLSEYTERNVGSTYPPVAVGRYGIRARESIYSKELAKDYSKNKLIFCNTLTVGMGSVQMDIGVLTDEVIYSVSPAYHTYRVSDINADYLRYCMECRNQDMFSRYVKRGSRQGKTVDLKRWLTYQIPVYSDVEQLEIVSRLDAVSALIESRKVELEMLDQLVKSQFVEMFGDPDCNDRGFPVSNLGSLLLIERGGSPRPISQYVTDDPDGVNWIKIGDAEEGSIYITHTSEKIKKSGIKKSRHVIPGDFLLSNSMSFGRPYILKIDGYIHDGWLVLRDREDIFDKMYLHALLSSDYAMREFTKRAAGTTVKNLNKDIVGSVPVLVPPLDLQRDFAAFVQQVDKSKFAVQQSIEQLELLKASLMQEYFG